MMKFLPFLVSTAGSALAALPAQIYVYPSPSSSTQGVSVAAPEANAILSHHLGISRYESLPKSLEAGSAKSQIVFGSTGGWLEDHADSEGEASRVVIVVYGANGKDIVPSSVADATPLYIASPPPPLAWDSLLSTYIGRFTHAFSVPLSTLFGVESFLALHLNEGGIQEWAKEWEERLSEWVRWGEQRTGLVKTQVMLKEEYSKWLTEYGITDSSAETLMRELTQLDTYVTSLPSQVPSLATLRFSGLINIERRYSRSSRQYASAVALLQSMLDAACQATLTASPRSKLIFLSVPSHPVHSRMGKRTTGSLLASFKTSERSFVPTALLDRRDEVFAGKSRIKRAPLGMPIVSSSRKCFGTAAECEDGTSGCNGHGHCVEGHRTIGGTCYVCTCGKTQQGSSGKTASWNGEFCEKKDISSEFVLLAGSTIGLLVLFSASVAVLYGVGSEELPQQLASVSGASKKHD